MMVSMAEYRVHRITRGRNAGSYVVQAKNRHSDRWFSITAFPMPFEEAVDLKNGLEAASQRQREEMS